MRIHITFALAVTAAAATVAAPAHGQAFADLKSALVDYSKSDLEPRKACDALGQFKSKAIAQIAAVSVPASATAPAHCKVSGLLSPEIAFEVSLPAKWNGRFYMIGNGGHAGENLDDPGRVAQKNEALRLGFAFAQTNTGHDARKEPGASFVMSNPQKAMSGSGVTPAKLEMVAEKVMNKCDAIDGLKDGLIDDPRKCAFNPARDVPACSAGADASADCLTAAQADAIAKVYSGPISNGTPFFPGYMPGSEAVMPTFGGGVGSGWLNVIVANGANAKPADFNLAENTMRYLVPTPPKPDWDYTTFNYDTDVHVVEAWSKQADAKNPDLSKFRKRGGKLLMTYGWADTILQPMMGVHYYEQAVAKNGPDTTEFFRLFMVPGMAHCGGGVGPDRHDAVTAMINWVEKGQAPSTMVASRVVNDQVVRTRPLCPYPQVARYSGTGSIDEASNFKCVAP